MRYIYLTSVLGSHLLSTIMTDLAEVFHHSFLLGVAQQAVGPWAPRKTVELLRGLVKKEARWWWWWWWHA